MDDGLDGDAEIQVFTFVVHRTHDASIVTQTADINWDRTTTSSLYKDIYLGHIDCHPAELFDVSFGVTEVSDNIVISGLVKATEVVVIIVSTASHILSGPNPPVDSLIFVAKEAAITYVIYQIDKYLQQGRSLGSG